MHVLITGGAGFIGRHLARALLDGGHEVRILDALIPQVHADASENVPEGAELLTGDVRDAALVRKALSGVDHVVHLAAEVGVGQSMYAVERYVGANDLGTAVLLQELIDQPVRRLVVASSMSVYGEGLYVDGSGNMREDVVRLKTAGALAQAGERTGYDPLDAMGRPLVPLPTPEWKAPNLGSVYALTKYVQERMCMVLCPHYGIEVVGLRLFNVYGPGQALSNPYTGVLANFAARILNGEPPLIFEDGRQMRDFVHVGDVARAFVLALEHAEADGEIFNVGAGQPMTIQAVGERLAAAMGSPIAPSITHKTRAGDIRHCFPDMGKAERVLGYTPQMDFDRGLQELAGWLAGQQAKDRGVQAREELLARGLVT